MTLQFRTVQAFDRSHPIWWDVAVAVLCGAASVNASAHLDPLGTAALVVVIGAVVVRRRFPRAGLLAAFACIVVTGILAVTAEVALPWAYLAVWVLLFNVGLRERVSLVVVSGIIAVTAVTALAAQAGEGVFTVDARVRSSLAVLGMGAASYLLGLQIRDRREQIAAEQLEVARSAVVAERARIAQEMHDIIGHNLSVITSLANGGAAAIRSSPDDAMDAFKAIGQVSRGSVRDVQRVLQVLRHDYDSDQSVLDPQPGLTDLLALVESSRNAGLSIRLEQTGDLTGLSAGRQLAVYRLVQESLTNALRHAGADARVAVSISRADDGIIVVVTDTGQPASATDRPAGAHRAGHGIIGMRERTEAFGGSLEAGPAGNGWTVRAHIPLDPAEDRP